MPRIREKRQASRVQPFVIPCRIVSRSRRLPAHLVDLSVAGARIASEEELPKAGSAITVEVRFGTSVTHLRLPGQVKWVRKAEPPLAGHLAGITFRRLTDRQKLAVEFVLYEFRRRAEALS